MESKSVRKNLFSGLGLLAVCSITIYKLLTGTYLRFETTSDGVSLAIHIATAISTFALGSVTLYEAYTLHVNRKKSVDTRSELIIDIDFSISKAYDGSLPAVEQKAVREHLAYILTRLREPNTQIEPTKAALLVMDARLNKGLPWFQRPAGVLTLAIIGSVVAAGIAKKFGLI
jgi:hypothetical protein